MNQLFCKTKCYKHYVGMVELEGSDHQRTVGWVIVHCYLLTTPFCIHRCALIFITK